MTFDERYVDFDLLDGEVLATVEDADAFLDKLLLRLRGIPTYRSIKLEEADKYQLETIRLLDMLFSELLENFAGSSFEDVITFAFFQTVWEEVCESVSYSFCGAIGDIDLTEAMEDFGKIRLSASSLSDDESDIEFDDGEDLRQFNVRSFLYAQATDIVIAIFGDEAGDIYQRVVHTRSSLDLDFADSLREAYEE